MSIEKKIDEILSQMTLHEKVRMCHGNSKFFSDGVERLGIDELSMMDGPHGVREECSRDTWATAGWTDDFCTYLPTGTALTATWNREMGALHGKTLGEEARYRKKDIILGPGCNVIRHPLCGRNFEYMSEDPCLIAEMIPGIISGIKSTDTAACVKHYALNNQELDRGHVNVELSDRALREIYLPGFKAAADAGAYSFMGAYNRYKEQHCCHNEILVNDILKGEWNWDGVYLSDWAGVHDTKEAAKYGMDLEMGTNAKYDEFYLGNAFEELCKNDPQYLELLNDKVRRILRLMIRVNKFSKDRKEGCFNTVEHQKATYDIAAEAMVLLKNDGVLPLKKGNGKILVIGENAALHHSHGGNSSGIKAYYERTPLDGIVAKFGESQVEYVKSSKFVYTPIPIEYLDIAEMKAGCRAFKLECFDTNDWTGESRVHYVDKIGLEEKGMTRKITGVLNIPEDGEYQFFFTGDRRTRLLFNGGLIHEFTSGNNGIPFEFSCEFKKGDRVDICIMATTVDTTPLEFLWAYGTEPMDEARLLEKAEAAEAVIYCGGLNHSFDTEGGDRPDMKLPGEQNDLIPKLIKANPNTVVVITAGSPVEMPWINEAKAVLWSWYAGMEGGNVIADILWGDICPSGKLPFTNAVKLEDCPAERYGEHKAENCKYNEDIFVGYRGHEKDGVKPLFAFGHGLSYASFVYSNLSLIDSGEIIEVSFDVANTSDVDGKEVAQVYFGLAENDGSRPIKELKGFDKKLIKAKTSERYNISISKENLMIWNDGWELIKGDYIVSIGGASDNISLTERITIL